MRTFELSRPTVGAQALGVARAAYEYALDYAKDAGPVRPADHREPGDRVRAGRHADGDRRGPAAGLAGRLDGPQQPARSTAGEGSMSKLKAGEVAVAVTEKAVQILGGAGYLRDHPVERWYRDAKIYTIFEGTTEIQRLVISRAISGCRSADRPRPRPPGPLSACTAIGRALRAPPNGGPSVDLRSSSPPWPGAACSDPRPPDPRRRAAQRAAHGGASASPASCARPPPAIPDRVGRRRRARRELTLPGAARPRPSGWPGRCAAGHRRAARRPGRRALPQPPRADRDDASRPPCSAPTPCWSTPGSPPPSSRTVAEEQQLRLLVHDDEFAERRPRRSPPS